MNRKNIEAVYNLSPLQEGMQFHNLLSPGSKSYFQQLYCRLDGNLNFEVFEEAWRTVISRHDVLRTGFVWEGLDKLLQVVQKEVKFKIETHSFEGFAEVAQKQKLEEFLKADKGQGVDPTKAPLMRISLIKTSETSWFMVWSHHHILLDGWSLTTLLREIFTVYESRTHGLEAVLAQPLPYRDYIKWINTQDRERAKQFWENNLREITHPSRLAVQKTVAVFDEENQEFIEIQKVLDTETTKRIRDFARGHRLTLNTLTQGAWAYLLGRYSGEEKVMFGVTINGRPTEIPGSERMVGLFINTLPICVEVKPSLDTLGWLAGIQQQQGSIEQFSYSSLVDIQGWSKIPRGTPLFETILVFENFPLADTSLTSNLGISIENPVLNEQTNYPLTAVAVPGDQMTLLISYNTRQFDSETAARLLENWVSALTSLVLDAPEKLAGVKLFSQFEEMGLNGFLTEAVELPQDDSFLHRIFEKQAKKTPSNIAVVTETEEITFERLNDFANRLANFLIEKGVVSETRVGICLERRWQMIGAMFAVLKSGGVYVPLNPGTPSERLKYMIEDSAMAAIVTETEFLAQLPTENLPAFVVDRDEALLETQSGRNPGVEISPENEAYIIYTSGSTGNPKGVVAVHIGIANFTLDIIRKLGLDENQRMLQFAPLSFDASAIQIYPPMLAGGGVVLNRKVTELSNVEILEYCRAKKVSVIDFPAGYWHQWLDDIEAKGLRIESRVRAFLTGGDRLSVEKLKQWARLTDANALFLSSYGPTETTVSATVFITTRDEILRNEIGNSQIGRPLSNVQIYVIDPRWHQQTPVGLGGELYISGFGLARNYLNEAELTADRFVPNPFSNRAGSRMYKTGDAVKYLPGGGLEFLGRSDQQVKIRGLRVEVGEIERELKKNPEIQETIVLALDDASGEKKLAAYIRTAADAAIAPQMLRSRLKRFLPEYMIPTLFYRVEQFPLLASGKVDRNLLRAEDHPELGGFEDFLPARNPFEQTVAEVWKDVLKYENIGVNQNFFELGGHSLLATQLISRIRNIFQIEIPLQSLFQNSTVAEFSAFLQNELTNEQENPVPKLSKTVRPARIPLSFSQERLFFIERLIGKNSIFNLTGILKIEGRPDLAILEQSVNAVISRHEALRTSFVEENGGAVQVIHSERKIVLRAENLTGTPVDKIEKLLNEKVRMEINTPFDLAGEVLLRARILKFGDELRYLLLTIHHIVSDGWSMGILAQEIARIYRNLEKENRIELPNLPVQYADYALWQKEWLNGSDFNREISYWQKQLAGIPSFLEIPGDFDRPPVQTYNGAQEQILLERDLSDQLKKLARQEGVTLFMLLLGVYKLLLYKYIGRTDIVVGTPTAGRQLLETEGLIGFFLNTLVLRTDLSGNPTFREILKKVRETCLDAYSHQNIPFEKLIEIVKPERDRSRTPLVQTVFNMLNLVEEKIELENLTITGLVPEDQWSKFDLTIYGGEREHRIFLNIVYNTALYTSSTIRQILDHYQLLLTKILANPSEKLDSYGLLSDTQLEEIYARNRNYKKGERTYNFGGNIVTRIEKQSADNENAVAVRDESSKFSYREIVAEADRIARFILEQNAETSGIGLLFGHHSQMIGTLLGVLRAGKFYVPLDVYHPAERLAEILLDADCRLLLTERARVVEAENIGEICRRQNPKHHLTIAEVETLPELKIETRPAISPEQIAYILYTSGSTGKPKGIYQSHRNVLKHIEIYSKSLEIRPKDKVLLLASYSFDASVMDIFGALLNGAELCLYDLRKKGFEELENYIRERQISIFHSTPTVFRAFAAGLRKDTIFRGIGKVVLGGEEVFRTDFEIFKRHFDHQAKLINGLGPTESTLALQYFMTPETALQRRSVPVGFPVENTKIRLLDEEGKETGLFGTGEIAIESDRLAGGYWKNDELTKRVFLNSESGPEKRVYLTGDLGRRFPDYSMGFLGRRDLQIKIRGQRAEIGEIEEKLTILEGVKAAAVVPKTTSGEDVYLAAFVVSAEGRQVSEAELKQNLRKDLPDFMIPASIHIIKEMPLTATGKIDRQKLLRIEVEAVQIGKGVAPPDTASEKLLHEIWREILNLEDPDVTDDFFAVGGHSLIATQIITRVRRASGVNLELREIFELPTIRLLAARIDEIAGNPSRTMLQTVQRRGHDDRLPLANAQKRLWFLNELEPGNPAYNMSIGFRVSGGLNHEVLERSINLLLERHESLRTVVLESDGHPLQMVKPFAPVALNLRDVTDEVTPDKESFAIELLRETVRKPFDLSAGPLIRHQIVKLADEQYLMMFCLHHIICDGWSVGVLTRELAISYMSFMNGEKVDLPALPFQYADFAIWQSSEYNRAELEYQIEYWKQKLGNDPAPLKLPYDRPLPNELTYKGEHKSFRIGREIISELDKICRRRGVTMFMLMLTAWKILFMRYGGQDEIVVGIPVAGRAVNGTENLIGMFVNTLVIRSFLSGSMIFEEALAEVKKNCIEAYAHQDLPFETLVSALKPTRDLSRVPLFEVMFNWLNFYENPEEIARSTNILNGVGLELEQMSVENNLTKFDISLILSEGENGISCVVEYNTLLFEGATIERILANLETLLVSIAANVERPVGRLPLISDEEAERILGFTENKEEILENELLVHQYFEKRADENPNTEAVVFRNESLTYGELEKRANRLANYLKSKGIGPENTVGLCIGRSFEMVVAALASVKTGAAYLPLDPEYPVERLNYMAADAGVAILLTTSTHTSLLNGGVAEILDLNRLDEELQHQPETPPITEAGLDNLCYVIYTSGSTGLPKGAMNVHRGVANRLLWMQNRYGFGPGDRILQMSSFSFDFSNWEIFGTLAAGATLVLPEPDAQRDFETVAELVRAENVTVAHFVPSQLQLFLDAVTSKHCPSLKKIFCGGEALSKTLVEKTHRITGATLHNQYGPTEASIDVTFWDCPENFSEANVPIGRPNANNRIYILDDYGAPVPVGSLGEIYIGGEAVGRGYCCKPRETAERFLPDPFAGKGGTRMYRTGDLGKWDNQGMIEYRGRADNQIKLRGFRIELGEIEKAILDTPDIEEAVVTLNKNKEADEKLVAYVVPCAGFSLTVNKLRESLAAKLPHYMIPSVFLKIDKIPLTSNGKLDRRALPDPEKSTLELGGEFEKPASEVEIRLGRVWAEVLGLEAVGVHDNFFALGGDSILSIQIVVKAREHGLNFNPRQLFKYQTIAELAPFTEFRAATKAEQGTIEGEIALLPIQIDFFERRLANPDDFSQSVMIDVGRRIEPEMMRRSIDFLVKHHDVLRSRFRQKGDFFEQIIPQVVDTEIFRTEELSGAPNTGEYLAAVVARSRKQISIENGPVFTSVLVHLGESEGWRVLLTAHHLVVDGVSWRILGDHLSRLYNDANAGSSLNLGEKTVSFRQWSSAVRKQFDPEKAREKAAIWLEKHCGENSLWTADNASGENSELFALRLNGRLETDETKTLIQEIPPLFDSPITNLLLLGWLKAVNQWNGADEILVAVEGHGREEVEEMDVSATTGWFTTVTPVATALSHGKKLHEQIVKSNEEITNCLENGRFFRELRYFGDEHEREFLSDQWRPQVSFNYLGQIRNAAVDGQSWKLAGESLADTQGGGNQRQYELDVNLIVVDGKLEVSLTFSGERYETSKMERLLDLYIGQLRDFIARKNEVQTDIENEKNRELIKDFDDSELDEILAEVEFEI